LDGMPASAVRLPPGDIIFAHLSCRLNAHIFSLHRE
jgi:hypothetical protein